MKVMTWRWSVVPLVWCLLVSASSANELAQYKEKYEKALEEIVLSHGMRVSDLNNEYRKAVENHATSVKRRGDLEGTKAALAEIERFKRDKSIPVEHSQNRDIQKFQATYANRRDKMETDKAKRILTLASQYDAALLRLQRQRTTADNLDAADAAQAERKRVAKTQPVVAAKATMSLAGSATNQVRVRIAERIEKQPKEEITARRTAEKASLYITCDERYVVWLNGEEIGRGFTWSRLDEYSISVAEGDILAIEATDSRGDRSGGLYCCILLESNNNSWGIDEDWRCSTKKPPADWASSKLVKFREPLSVDNVANAHIGRSQLYRKDHPHLQGVFVWSKKVSKTVYIHRTISFENFSEAK